jgi:hypothetical protein
MNKELNKVKNEGIVSTRCDMKLLEKALKKTNKELEVKYTRYQFLRKVIETMCTTIIATDLTKELKNVRK